MTTPMAVRISVLIGAVVLAGNGCSVTRRTTRPTELERRHGRGPIRALTVDSSLYTFRQFQATDSTLGGTGTVKRNGVTSPFSGSVSLRDIVFLERRESDFGKGVLVVPAVIAVVGGLAAVMDNRDTFTIREPSGGSCPYLYAFDGTGFRLEAEAFSTSISRSLESRTLSILPSLAPVDGRLTVRIRNERPETHLLNSVNLLVADAGDAESAVLDINQALWPLHRPAGPAMARDQVGRNVLPLLSERDRRYWTSDPRDVPARSGFRDRLELEFEVPPGVAEATLVIRAINTELITDVYGALGTVLGDATLDFYRALEEDAELQDGVREWIGKSSLLVEMESDGNWHALGAMPPEGNAVPFDRAVRIGNLAGRARVKLRLSAMSQVWRIDGVGMDFSPARPLALSELQLVSVTASDGRDWESSIRSADSAYALILPPDHLDLAFRSGPAGKMRHPVYVVAAQGYLYEWFPPPDRAIASVLPDGTTGSAAVDLVKAMIRQEGVLLTAIYGGGGRGRTYFNPER